MRSLPVAAIAFLTVAGAFAQDGPERWHVRSTGPVTIALDAGGQVGTVWARNAEGEWHQLEPRVIDGRATMTLGPEAIGGGSALVVIDPPQWLAMDDATPPRVVRFTVDGHSYVDKESVDLGWIGRVPRRILLAVADDQNPIDRSATSVVVAGRYLDLDHPAVTLTMRDERRGTVKVLLRMIEGLDEMTSGVLEIVVDDYAIDENVLRRTVTWSLAPSLELDDGTIVTVDSITDSPRWEDWSVIFDGEPMTENDTTTAGKTWLSAESDGEHWLRMRFPEPRVVNGVDLWWPYYETWRTSRHYEIQALVDGEWVTQLTVSDQEEKQHSEHRFEPVRTTAIQILQPPMGGQAERQNLMWLAEVAVSYAE